MWSICIPVRGCEVLRPMYSFPRNSYILHVPSPHLVITTQHHIVMISSHRSTLIYGGSLTPNECLKQSNGCHLASYWLRPELAAPMNWANEQVKAPPQSRRLLCSIFYSLSCSDIVVGWRCFNYLLELLCCFALLCVLAFCNLMKVEGGGGYCRSTGPRVWYDS